MSRIVLLTVFRFVLSAFSAFIRGPESSSYYRISFVLSAFIRGPVSLSYYTLSPNPYTLRHAPRRFRPMIVRALSRIITR